MTANQGPNFNNVIAALQLLGSGSGGVQNVPTHGMSEDCGPARPGRSDPRIPLAGSDRPTWESFRRLERENRLLIDHAEMLACALGACPNCWGGIPDCEECGGLGIPGAYQPDRSCFDHFVLPVIIRVMGRDLAPQDTDSRPDPHHMDGEAR